MVPTPSGVGRVNTPVWPREKQRPRDGKQLAGSHKGGWKHSQDLNPGP